MIRFPWIGWLLIAASAAAQEPRRRPLPDLDKNPKTGLAIGSKIPLFEAVDQNGKRQTFESLRGPKGLALLFVRSADWWPFCKSQLVELGQQQEAYRNKGLGVAALSYDGVELLRNFAERKGLHYPLLSDPKSKVIRAFNILNENFPRDNPWFGAPYPGAFLIDERGVVKAKYFEDDHRERYTAASILVHELGADGLAKTTVETPHLSVSYSASDARLSPGGRTTLIVDIDLKPQTHVYAPGIGGNYIPIEWAMSDSKGWVAHPTTYPPSRKLHLPAIDETVPVYEGHFRLTRDVTIGQQQEIGPLLGPDRTATMEGVFRYQACDDKMCYIPKTIPVKWTFTIDRLDSQRAPVELQRK